VTAFAAGAIVRRATLLVALALPLAAVPVSAQEADSARVGPVPPRRPAVVRDSSRLVPPVSPRRAFLTSLLVPGLAQERLKRRKARTLFAVVEAGSAFMIVKSARDLRDAKEAPDSVPYGYTVTPAGSPGVPFGGFAFTPVNGPNLIADRVRARRTHLEDWIALLVFNHLISGADAFVAAHLWDLPAQVSTSESAPRTLNVGIRRSFR
jgi:hypothetical protein